MPQCQHVKSDGSPCRAKTQNGKGSCFFHDPEKEAERAEASRRGGQAGKPKVLPDAPRIAVDSSSDVCRLLGDTLNRVRRGELDPKVSNAIGYLCGITLKGFEQARIEENLRALLAAVTECRRPRAGDDLTNVSHLVEG